MKKPSKISASLEIKMKKIKEYRWWKAINRRERITYKYASN